MKNEDAVKYWRGAKAEGEKYIDEGTIDEIFKDQLTYYDMAILALEKQIPKEPVKDRYSCVCQACGFGELTDENYCPDCGQALKWEEGGK